jgi:hypothetical protein
VQRHREGGELALASPALMAFLLADDASAASSGHG